MSKGRPLVLMVLPFVAVGCVTSSQVSDRTQPLTRLLDEHHDAMYACAPRELATARAAIVFARHETAQGRPMSASRYVEQAEAASKKAFLASRSPWCMNDRDGDTIPDEVDRCPDAPEDMDGFEDEDGCPDLDNDQDGVPDRSDRCPNEPGPAKNDGCPIRDADDDGVLDDVDRCPNQAGPAANQGCPWPDRDGDGVMDRDDRCPDEAGPPGNQGCPYKLVEVTESQIVLRQTVHFQTGKARIKTESHPLLDEVAEAMLDHPTMRVRVEGHTDSIGDDRTNLRLSQARADAVRRYLMSRGVTPDRMTAIGYGEDNPLDDNATEVGRAINRRVEFHILSR